MALLRRMPARKLAQQLLRPIGNEPETAVRSRGGAVAGQVERLVAEPRAAAADFIGFVSQSWDEWFADEWTRVRPLLTARARLFSDSVNARGAIAALAALDGSIKPAVRRDGITIDKVQSARHDVSRRGLLVAPSAFIQPHLYVANVPARPLLLIHPVEAGPPVVAATDLFRRLDAVANPGRLEVARAIATEPRTAGEIAALWNVDPTLVNRHLRQLATAGLARTTRSGRFVRYELDADAVQRIGADLAALLLR